jgi:hypothetical protein
MPMQRLIAVFQASTVIEGRVEQELDTLLEQG